MARAWVEEAVNASRAGVVFTLMPMVVASLLRLVTSPKIFRMPTPIEDAVAVVGALLASPRVQLAPLGPERSNLRQRCLGKRLAGNEVPDAWLAAAVAQLGEHLVGFSETSGRCWCATSLR